MSDKPDDDIMDETKHILRRLIEAADRDEKLFIIGTIVTRAVRAEDALGIERRKRREDADMLRALQLVIAEHGGITSAQIAAKLPKALTLKEAVEKARGSDTPPIQKIGYAQSFHPTRND